MTDKEFWKKKYAHSWENATKRVHKVIDALKAKGIKAEPHGFLATSKEYSKESPEEKGAPDLIIPSVEVFVEVTGPDKAVSKDADLWIRWDKFKYAENHPEKEIWVAHILESENDLIRFLKLGKGVKERYEEIKIRIRGAQETYRSIPAGYSNLFSFEKFCNYIKAKQ